MGDAIEILQKEMEDAKKVYGENSFQYKTAWRKYQQAMKDRSKRNSPRRTWSRGGLSPLSEPYSNRDGQSDA